MLNTCIFTDSSKDSVRKERIMLYTISGYGLTATVSDAGAELMSLQKEGKEYLWSGDPAFWGRRSPVLFPFVGQVRDKKYRFNGKEYAMGQHGFARDQVFTLAFRTDSTISFVLHENEETLSCYPFRFELEIRYELTADAGLKVTWIVRNKEEDELYFSIGGHPAFLCPLDGGDWGDCRIRLTKAGTPLEQIRIHPITTGGNVGSSWKELKTTDGCLIPSDELFAGDALILEDSQADEAALVGPDGRPYLTLTTDAPLLGIWSPVGKHAPFICLEPWYGRTDADDFSGELQDRAYGNMLKKGEMFTASYSVSIDAHGN